MSRIPEARTLLEEIAIDLKESGLLQHADRIEAVIPMLIRQKYKRRASAQSVTMTEELKRKIKNYAESNRHLSAQSIANHFQVNPGRVSEAMRLH